MKIAATAVSMDAARSYKEVENALTTVASATAGASSPGRIDDFGLRLSQMLASSTQTRTFAGSGISRSEDRALPAGAKAEQDSGEVISQWAEQLLGQPVTLTALSRELFPSAARSREPTPPVLAARSAELFSCTVYHQEESVQFAASGAVQTEDGREIAFDFGLSMERSTTLVTSASMAAGNLFIDPLLLQFDLGSALLSDSSFLFDLDSDGTRESLACPGRGCGFLAFDRNSDGLITSGRELFGPESGSGFGELAELDSDANQWIDENDPIFDQLLIWRPDGQGGETLVSLRQAGVGAISVRHAGTEFQLEGSTGTILGRLKAGGIFLTEAGEVRSLAEVDLARAATRSDLGQGGGVASSRRLEAALEGLREIISLQRFRLQMMLTGERLRGAMAGRADLSRQLLDWLRPEHRWQPPVALPPEPAAAATAAAAPDRQQRADPAQAA